VPTAVEPDDRAVIIRGEKLGKTPNSFYPNQYENAMNPGAHYQTTARKSGRTRKEKSRTSFAAWARVNDSGVGRYLKEKNPT